jgi:hypothetical protein
MTVATWKKDSSRDGAAGINPAILLGSNVQFCAASPLLIGQSKVPTQNRFPPELPLLFWAALDHSTTMQSASEVRDFATGTSEAVQRHQTLNPH